ncbi:MAG: class I SAM-dependent methyltransferase [Polyangiaceae bacterium]
MKVEEHLAGAFGHADRAHAEWQTTHPILAREEARLVRACFLPLGERVLDLGCAEGATLLHLGDPRGAVGLDLFEDKLTVARELLEHARLVQGSAYELPFPDGSFDHVLIRDVVHHLDEPERAAREVHRVLGPGGRVDVLEPCRYNPLIAMHAALNPAERGELRSTPSFLSGLFRDGCELATVARHQPLPLHRLVFHPSLGAPRAHWLDGPVAALERAAASVLPRAIWAYIHVRATRR